MINKMASDLPFEIQVGDFSDEDYAILDEYYCQPSYERDGSKIDYFEDKYPFLKSSDKEIDYIWSSTGADKKV